MRLFQKENLPKYLIVKEKFLNNVKITYRDLAKTCNTQFTSKFNM